MFGHQDSNKDDAKDKAESRSIAPTTIAPTAGDKTSDTASSATPTISPAKGSNGKVGSGSVASSAPVSSLDLSELDDLEASLSAVDKLDTKSDTSLSSSATSSSKSETNAASAASPAPARASTAAAGSGSNDLHELKLTVLHELSPIVDQLEQSAEEHFRTLMMMIQSAEDQSLLPQAYDAALKIEDKKVRAQALLDVVNEINYFTQQPS